ncbi:hypothetical protein C6496_07500 [Candidatus Poribacteria bacterium]|nr:MAG: hypothetical protein C6496_07500 [Candidatus Poribacteria bacterium]
MKSQIAYLTLAVASLCINNVYLPNVYALTPGTPYITFASNRAGSWDLYMIDVNGKDLLSLTNHPADELDPAWSPDGRFLAYVSNQDGNFDIYLMDAHKQEHWQLTNFPGGASDLTWSPDGQWIAYAHDAVGRQDTDIYRIDINGKNLKRLTNLGLDYGPAWSPDGQWLAFYSVNLLERKASIYMGAKDGKNLREITKSSARGPTWSPDGRQIAFPLSHGIGISHITVIDVDVNDENQQERHQLSDNPGFNKFPAWSPDGEWIAYVSKVDSATIDLYVINLVTEKQRKLTGHLSNVSGLAWVPETFFSVSPSIEKMTTLWGELKHP